MLDLRRSALLASATAYLFLLPSNALSFWRSLAFGIATLCAAMIAVAALKRPEERVPHPGRPMLGALALWAAWALASTAWSIDPAYTLSELKSDLAWSIATMGVCYLIAAKRIDGWRLVAGTLLAGMAFWPALVVGFELSPARWNPRLAHMGVVAYSTYLATVAPLLLLLLWRPPIGFGASRSAIAVAALLFGLVLATARLSDNRIVWLAFGASIVVASLCAGRLLPRMPMLAAVTVLLIAFGLLFADAARDRALSVYPPKTSVADTLAADPRPGIWRHAIERIGERPWHGYGYGRLIMKEDLRAATGNRLLTHAHNMFVSQWLQTGAIGVALLLLLFGTWAASYVAWLRTSDTMLVRLGTIGLAVLAAFVIKNLTDDFFFRANAKLLFAVNGALLGAGASRARELRGPQAFGTTRTPAA
jgi:O-antigen ligase